MALNESKNSHKDKIDSLPNANNNKQHYEDKINSSKHSKSSQDKKIEFNNKIEFNSENALNEHIGYKENGGLDMLEKEDGSNQKNKDISFPNIDKAMNSNDNLLKVDAPKEEGYNSIHLVSQNNHEKSLLELGTEKKDISSPYSPPNNQDFKSKDNKEDAEKQPMIELGQIKDHKEAHHGENKDQGQFQYKKPMLEQKISLFARDNGNEKINEQQIFKKEEKEEEKKKEDENKKPPDSATKVFYHLCRLFLKRS